MQVPLRNLESVTQDKTNESVDEWPPREISVDERVSTSRTVAANLTFRMLDSFGKLGHYHVCCWPST